MDADIASPYPDLRTLWLVVINIVFFLRLYEMFKNQTTIRSTFAKRRALPDMRIASMTHRAAPVGLHDG